MGARRFTGRAAAVVVSAIAALGIAGTLSMSAASAATPVTATTSMTNVPDTTNGGLPGTACGTSANGPTWATDQFPTVTLSATEVNIPANTWDVTISSTGSYVSFADPTTCDPLLSEGNITGSIEFIVTSATAPTASGLHANYTGETEFSTLIDDWFGGTPTIGGGDIYNYAYQDGNYTQVGTEGGGLTVTGDVKAVACTVTVTNPGNQSSTLSTAIAGLQVAASSNYPGTLHYDASNLPKGLSIDTTTGKITGTPTKTGTSAVTVGAVNTAYSSGDGSECSAGTATFNWTVSVTAPAPSPSPSSTGSTGGGSSSNFPTGAPATGGGKPANGTWVPIGGGVAGLLLLGSAVALLRRRQAAN